MSRTPARMPLKTTVKDGQLIITVGIEYLGAWFERSNYAEIVYGNNRHFAQNIAKAKDERFDKQNVNRIHVTNAKKFARDVAGSLMSCDDGATILTEALDKAMEEAYEDGSNGIKEFPDKED